MNKKLIVALAAAAATASYAQSSVTLTGNIDAAVRHATGSIGNTTSLGSGGISGSRIHFRGIEDLGGGMSASFWLEAQFDASNGAGLGTNTNNQASGNAPAGQTGIIFNRRSTVSLAGSWGELRLGRDYTPQFWTTTIFDAFGTNGPGSSLNISTAGANGLASGATTFVRANNSIGYFLPGGLGGLYGQVQVSAGENAIGNKHTSFRLGYAAGPFNVAVATGKTETGANDFKMNNIGASYDFGAAKVMGYINNSKFGAVKERLTHLGVSAPFGATTLRAGYTQNNTSGGGFDTRDAKQFAIGLVYDLSKRTALYTDLSRVSNSAGANYSVGSGATNTLGHSARGFDVGVRHAF